MQRLVELETSPTEREGLTIYMQLIIKGCQMSEWELVILWLNAHHMPSLLPHFHHFFLKKIKQLCMIF